VREKRNAYRVFVRKPKGKSHYEDLDVDGRIKLKFILEK
jgi:hypothetical protein